MSGLVREAINTALNNPRDWKVALLVVAFLIVIGLFTGVTQKFITFILGRGNKKNYRGSDRSQKITVIGSYNTIEGQSIDAETQVQSDVTKRQKNKAHIQCQIETLVIDDIGDGLSFNFIDNRYFASLGEINKLCSKSKIIQGVYELTEDKVVNLVCLFKLFNPNRIAVSYSENLKVAIAKELAYRDISLEIITAVDVAKRLPFQKLKNNYFGVSNHNLGVFVNKK